MTESTADEAARLRARLAEIETPSPSMPPAPTPRRKVGIPLAVGIFFVPFVFVWLLLRHGHSTLARVLGFGWFGLGVLVWIAVINASPSTVAASDASSSATADAQQAAAAATDAQSAAADAQVAAAAAATDAAAADHNWIYKEGLTYGYASGLSEDDKKAGKAISDVVMLRYLGTKDGLYRLLSVDDGTIESCANPCRVIKAGSDHYMYNPNSVIGAALQDAFNGKLEVYAPDKRRATDDE